MDISITDFLAQILGKLENIEKRLEKIELSFETNEHISARIPNNVMAEDNSIRSRIDKMREEIMAKVNTGAPIDMPNVPGLGGFPGGSGMPGVPTMARTTTPPTHNVLAGFGGSMGMGGNNVKPTGPKSKDEVTRNDVGKEGKLSRAKERVDNRTSILEEKSKKVAATEQEQVERQRKNAERFQYKTDLGLANIKDMKEVDRIVQEYREKQNDTNDTERISEQE